MIKLRIKKVRNSRLEVHCLHESTGFGVFVMNSVHKLLTSAFDKLFETKEVNLLYYNISKTNGNIPMQLLLLYFNDIFFYFLTLP